MLNRKIEGESIVLCDGGNKILTIGEAMTEEGIRITLEGALRSDVAHELQDELIAMTTVGANVTVDMSGVTYISSTVQSVFLMVQQKMDSMGKGTLTLCKLPEAIFQEFDRNGASELLLIED